MTSSADTGQRIQPGSTIGILGGGQLGRMAAMAAARLGYRCHIYCPDPQSPAFDVAATRTVAAYEDEAALTRFAEAVDLITLEFENVPASTAEQLAAARPFRPAPAILAVAQDRLKEKDFLAGIFMAPVLTVIADTAGMIGGWIIAVFNLNVGSGVYWSSVTEALFLGDAWMGIIKPFALGFVIVTIGCHVGLRTRGGTQGVGRSTTNAVVAGSVAVIAVDFFITPLLIELLY